MKVVHVIAGLGVGGAELVLKRLVLAAHDSRYFAQHSVVSLGEQGVVGAQLREAGVPVESLGIRSTRHVPSAVLRLRNRLLTLKPNVVQTWMYHGDLLGGVAAHLAGIAGVVWGVRASALIDGTPRTTRIARWSCARLSSRIPAVIVCAAEAARRAHVAFGYDASRMVVIPNGFEIPAQAKHAGVAAFRALLGWSADELVIGTVGRFDPYKDFPNFVASAVLVAKREPRARFLMIGSGLDENNAKLMSWIVRAGLGSRFALLGTRGDIPACMAAMDVFVLPSRSEGFPNVVGEAMAMGVPCVVTDVGDAALLVGKTGEVVVPENAEALSIAICRLLALPDSERRSLGRQARSRIEAEFSMGCALERFAAVYERAAIFGGT